MCNLLHGLAICLQHCLATRRTHSSHPFDGQKELQHEVCLTSQPRCLPPPLWFVLTLFSATSAKADSISISSTAVAPITLTPSNDTLSFPDSSVLAPGSGTVTFATGTFYVGNSPIPDQITQFSFITSITVNGITKNITIFGEDDVTTATDVAIIYAGAPIQFGDVTFTLDTFTTDPGGVGANLPIELAADVTATPRALKHPSSGNRPHHRRRRHPPQAG